MNALERKKLKSSSQIITEFFLVRYRKTYVLNNISNGYYPFYNISGYNLADLMTRDSFNIEFDFLNFYDRQ